MSDDYTRLSVNIRPEVAKFLKKRAAIQDVNVTTIVDRALLAIEYLIEEQERGRPVAIRVSEGFFSSNFDIIRINL